MKNKCVLFLLLLSLLATPVFSLSPEEMRDRLEDNAVYADENVTLWRVPWGLDGRELLFSMGDIPPVSGTIIFEEHAVLKWDYVEGASYYRVFGYEDGEWRVLAQTDANIYIDQEVSADGSARYAITAHSREEGIFHSSFLSEDLIVLEEETAMTENTSQEQPMTPETPTVDEVEESSAELPSLAETPPPNTGDPLITRVVNKKHPIEPLDYYPDDLVSVGTQGQSLRAEAADAFNRMNEAASAEGYPLIAQSGFRDYEWQEYLYDRYVSDYGKSAADTFSARPGYSEHQTGLVMDILAANTWIGQGGGFEFTGQFRWLNDNAHKYGWINRYPEGYEAVTGYMWEPWHWRYIGVEDAMRFHNSGVKTLEEFYSIEGGDYIE